MNGQREMGLTQARQGPRRPLELEALEERMAPAGGVLAYVSAGTLVIAGDQLANNIIVDDAGLDAGQLRVSSGLDSTTVNGAAAEVFAGVTGSLVLKMGDGADRVRIDAIDVTGSIAFDGGPGSNWLEALGGCVVDKSFVAGNAHTVAIAGARVSGDLRIDNGSGNSSVVITDVEARSLIVRNGAGDDLLDVDNLVLAGALRVANGAGDTNTYISDSRALRLVVSNGSGQDYLDARNLTCTSTGLAVRISNGSGASGDAICLSTISGSVAINSDIIDFDDTTITKGVTASGGVQRFHAARSDIGIDAVNNRRYSIRISAGTMSLVELSGVNLGGSLVATFTPYGLFTYGWPVYVDIDGASIGGNIVVDSRTFGETHFTVAGSDVAGSTRIVTRAWGQDTIKIDDSSFSRSVTILTGGGNDYVAIEANGLADGPVSVFSGALVIRAGEHDDALVLGVAGQPGQHGDYLGLVVLDGGAGTNTLTIPAGANTFATEPLVSGF